MIFRKVLAPLTGGPNDAATLFAAFAFGKIQGCHVDACLIQPDPDGYIPYIPTGVGYSTDLVAQIIEAAEQAAEQATKLARVEFEKACQFHQVDEIDEPGKIGTASASWRVLAGRPDARVPPLARVSDLTVFGGGIIDYKQPSPGMPESTLLGSGRPILFGPGRGFIGEPKSIVIAWDGSLQAARTIAMGQRILLEAEQLEIVSVKETPDHQIGDDLGDYLSWHGLESRHTVVFSEDGNVGKALLDAAEELGADLLMMGGYAHSRFREVILGGTTRYVLCNTSLPVFLAH